MIANDSAPDRCYGGGVAQSVDQFVSTVTEALRDTEASEDVVREVEEKGTELTEAVESRGEELQSLRDQSGSIQELRRENQELRAELAEYRETNEKDKASMKGRISSVEAGTGDGNPTPEGEETALHRPETPLENVVSLPETMVESELSSNQERARFLARDVSQYATKVPAGRSLDYSTIKTALAARGDTPHGQTIIRVMNFLDRLGKDGTKDVERRGKRRIVFTEDAVERLERLSNSGKPGEEGTGNGVVSGVR